MTSPTTTAPGKGPAIVPLPYDATTLPPVLGDGWRERLAQMYRGMLLGRTLDARMLNLQRQGRVGFYGPAAGQEAASVGAALALEPQDWVFPGLREQLIALVRGYDLPRYVHHLFGNDMDPAKGRQMPCHPSAREVQYVSMSSVIGTQIVHAVGCAFAQRYRKDRAISVAFFGDGATSANDFHSGMNFAGVFDLPVLFVCTNNQWAISVPTAHQTAAPSFAAKASAYGFPGERVDGTDVIAVYHHVRRVRGAMAEDPHPYLLELVLYRLTPHSSSDDPSRYQPKGWMEEAMARDPLARLEELLDRTGVLPASEREAIRRELDAEIRSAIQEAEVIPPPRNETLFQDTLKEPSWPLTEERDSFDREQGGHFP